jgi:hypothetical protein
MERANHPLFNPVKSEAPVLELGRFAMEAVLMAAGTRDVVREVRVRENWIILERGSAPIDAATATVMPATATVRLSVRATGTMST